jgi:uncharacterized circularly permuted ATP-grasp superfamily protein
MIKVIKDKIIPKELILSSAAYLKKALRRQRHLCHITGSDLIKGGDGQYYVLEDNLRCPSGVCTCLKTERSLKELFLNYQKTRGETCL